MINLITHIFVAIGLMCSRSGIGCSVILVYLLKLCFVLQVYFLNLPTPRTWQIQFRTRMDFASYLHLVGFR
jgi:hypothetical protein